LGLFVGGEEGETATFSLLRRSTRARRVGPRVLPSRDGGQFDAEAEAELGIALLVVPSGAPDM